MVGDLNRSDLLGYKSKEIKERENNIIYLKQDIIEISII